MKRENSGQKRLQAKPWPKDWLDKPYYSLNAYFKRTYGEKIYKIALDAGFSCPNRDGTLDTRGCIFCSKGGSGEFAAPLSCTSPTLESQLQAGLSLFREKKAGSRFVAYFQAYTNTYASVSYLEEIYKKALDTPSVIGISIATRPDCLPASVLSLLRTLQKAYPEKFIWVELGLQTIHEKTAVFIRRGYPLSCFYEAVWRLQEYDIPVIVHMILGLPGETKAMACQGIDYVNTLPVFGIKLQLLHILKGTDLELVYQKDKLSALTLEEYASWVIACLERLSPKTVVHRITGDGPKALLCAPLWSLDKRRVLNTLHQRLAQENTWQGRKYHDTGSFNTL